MLTNHPGCFWSNADTDLHCHMASLGHNQINILKSEQNGHHFAYNIFTLIFDKKKFQFEAYNFSEICVPLGLNDIKSPLVQIIGWCRIADEPLSQPMMALFADTPIRHLASMSSSIRCKVALRKHQKYILSIYHYFAFSLISLHGNGWGDLYPSS